MREDQGGERRGEIRDRGWVKEYDNIAVEGMLILNSVMLKLRIKIPFQIIEAVVASEVGYDLPAIF